MSISEKLLGAVDVIVEKALSDAKFDRTVNAIIVSCEDSTTGKYKVKYEGNTFIAYYDNVDNLLNDGITVLLLIPEGDFSLTKKILGPASGSNITAKDVIPLEDYYIDISPDLIPDTEVVLGKSYGFIDLSKEQFITLYKHGNENNKITVDLETLKERLLLDDKPFLKFIVLMHTEVVEPQTLTGDFGLGIVITEGGVEKLYILNTAKMRGYPYTTLGWEPQVAVISIDKTKFEKIDLIFMFIGNPDKTEDRKFLNGLDFGMFEVDAKEYCTILEINPANNDSVPYDISFKEFELYVAKKVDDSYLSTSQLTIRPVNGHYNFREDIDQIALEAVIKKNGRELKAVEAEYYWFMEKPDVTSSNPLYKDYIAAVNETTKNTELTTEEKQEALLQLKKDYITKLETSDYKYNPVGGEGWKYLGSSKTWVIKRSEQLSKNRRYKCVAIIRNKDIPDTELSAIETIKNSTAQYDISVTVNPEYFTSGQLGEAIFNCVITKDKNAAEITPTYVWTRNVDDRFSTLESTLATAKLNSNEITSTATYYCTVYNGEKYIGCANKNIRRRDDKSSRYTIDFINSPAVYIYDESGNAPTVQKANMLPVVIKPISFVINDNETGESVESSTLDENIIKWYILKDSSERLIKPNVNEKTGYVDKEFKATDDETKLIYEVYKGKTFSYLLDSRYNKKAVNGNYIYMRVEYGGETLTSSTNIMCNKVGDPGVNSTSYATAIYPYVSNNNTTYHNVTVPLGATEENYIFDRINSPDGTGSITGNDGRKWFLVTLTKDLTELYNSRSNEEENYSVLWSLSIPPVNSTVKEEAIEASNIKTENSNSPNIPKDKDNSNSPNIIFDVTKLPIHSYDFPSLVSLPQEAITDESVVTEPDFHNVIKARIAVKNTIGGKSIDSYYYTATPITTYYPQKDGYSFAVVPDTGARYIRYSTGGVDGFFDESPFEIEVKLTIDDKVVDISLDKDILYEWITQGTIYDGKQWIRRNYITVDTGRTLKTTLGWSNSTTEDESEEEKLELKKNLFKIKVNNKVPYDGSCTSIAIAGRITYKSEIIGYIHIPLYTYLNTSGFRALNDWDGLSIEISPDGGYIMAPQVGAGEKNEYGQFSGVLMGSMVDGSVDGINNKKIGFLGFSKGVLTIFLDAEHGTATFGRSASGRIYIDGENSSIEGGGYKRKNPSASDPVERAGSGLKIDLKEPSIKYGNENFTVNGKGELTCKGASVEGRFHTEVEDTNSEMSVTFDAGGFNISNISKDESHMAIIDSQNGGTIIFQRKVQSEGSSGDEYEGLSYTNGQLVISGEFHARRGTIGGWDIKSNSIEANNGVLKLYSNGRIVGAKIDGLAESSIELSDEKLNLSLAGGNLNSGLTVFLKEYNDDTTTNLDLFKKDVENFKAKHEDEYYGELTSMWIPTESEHKDRPKGKGIIKANVSRYSANQMGGLAINSKDELGLNSRTNVNIQGTGGVSIGNGLNSALISSSSNSSMYGKTITEASTSGGTSSTAKEKVNVGKKELSLTILGEEDDGSVSTTTEKFLLIGNSRCILVKKSSDEGKGYWLIKYNDNNPDYDNYYVTAEGLPGAITEIKGIIWELKEIKETKSKSGSKQKVYVPVGGDPVPLKNSKVLGYLNTDIKDLVKLGYITKINTKVTGLNVLSSNFIITDDNGREGANRNAFSNVKVSGSTNIPDPFGKPGQSEDSSYEKHYLPKLKNYYRLDIVGALNELREIPTEIKSRTILATEKATYGLTSTQEGYIITEIYGNTKVYSPPKDTDSQTGEWETPTHSCTREFLIVTDSSGQVLSIKPMWGEKINSEFPKIKVSDLFSTTTTTTTI